ncbi:MAG: amidase family protein, partial [Metallosphaera sp.]
MIGDLVNSLKSGDLDPNEYVAKTFERIRKHEGKIKAFITIRDEQNILNEVKQSIKVNGRLSGVLIAIKDNISTKGIRTTCASRTLDNYV